MKQRVHGSTLRRQQLRSEQHTNRAPLVAHHDPPLGSLGLQRDGPEVKAQLQAVSDRGSDRILFVTDVMPLPHGPKAALNGLREAVSRLHDTVSRVLRGGTGEAIWIVLSEALYWVAAMNDRYRKADADYFSRRDEDPGGRTVAGLVYARNNHAHKLVSAGEAVFEIGTPRVIQIPPGEMAPPPGHGTVFSMQLRWVTLGCLPARKGQDDRVFYQHHIAGQPITHPFDAAIEWFERCIVAETSNQIQD